MLSHEGLKANFITSPRQLTISHGSEIENVNTGSGNDTVIGNSLSNVISTSSGEDIIFAGDGMDTISPGLGKDIIDLSEDFVSTDILILAANDSVGNSNSVYGFSQVGSPDIINFENFNFAEVTFLPLLKSSYIPFGYVDDCLVRIFGENLNNRTDLEQHLNSGGILQNLKLTENSSALFITAESQDTGEDQSMYIVKREDGYNHISLLSQFYGNYLDIDNWSSDNFIF